MLFIKLLFFCISINSFAQISKTPKFLTKQSLKYLRFIDQSGKLTYYQTSNGSLNLTTNYDNTVLHQSEKNAMYYVSNGFQSNYLIIELDDKYFSNHDFMKDHQIFISKIGEKKLRYITKGRVPIVSSDEKWLGYFRPKENKVYFEQLSGTKKVDFKLLKKNNSFFFPSLGMISPEGIVYTDINQKGHMALRLYNTTDKIFSNIYKSKFSGSKLEFCKINDSLFIGDFGIYDSVNGSTILEIPLYNNKSFKKQKILYRSEYSDIGNLICDKEKIYFIKTLEFNSNLNMQKTEVASINLKTSKLKIETDIRSATNIIRMGNRILSPHRESFYIVKGDYDTTKQDQLQK